MFRYPHFEDGTVVLCCKVKWTGEIAIMKKYVEYDPFSIPYLLHLACLNLYGGHYYNEARNILFKILELDPLHGECYLADGHAAMYDFPNGRIIAASSNIVYRFNHPPYSFVIS
ncbi:MAG TPA: hypothetical protein VFW07_25250 [Parafilimonas sp.]|nr:hypothetical protein [Parafilimonas sp.]